eukprot:CAMPEP_0175024764 /NCGR_PEP_ID=MMETSP0005-20121125/16663_1 /TAXON_ID=420556 /ORGANISM="Ochromonas sp., Strain CCMP1393" /LENGTH=179 /DNA_ID=CAMNT_0016283383 /DNA_START=323 /DNA_END=864 /DNA_ORIENTATION=-
MGAVECGHLHSRDSLIFEGPQQIRIASVDTIPGTHGAIVRRRMELVDSVPGDGGDAACVTLGDTARRIHVIPPVPDTHNAVRGGGDHQRVVSPTHGHRSHRARGAFTIVRRAQRPLLETLLLLPVTLEPAPVPPVPPTPPPAPPPDVAPAAAAAAAAIDTAAAADPLHHFLYASECPTF